MISLSDLRAMAMAATPGKWYATEWTCHAPTSVAYGNGQIIAECTGFGRDTKESVPDAAYIAALNPQTARRRGCESRH